MLTITNWRWLIQVLILVWVEATAASINLIVGRTLVLIETHTVGSWETVTSVPLTLTKVSEIWRLWDKIGSYALTLHLHLCGRLLLLLLIGCAWAAWESLVCHPLSIEILVLSGIAIDRE